MNARLLAVAQHSGGVFTASDAASVEVSGTELRRMTRRGEVIRLRRDAYVLADAWAAASPEGRLALRTRAVLRTRLGLPTRGRADRDIQEKDVDEGAASHRSEGCVPDAACHQSALSLYDLPLHGVKMDVVDLLSAVSRVRLSSGLRTQPGDHQIVTVDGTLAVTIPVAIAQVLQRSGLLAALVPLDAALRTKKCTIEQVGAAVETVLGPGNSRGQRLLQMYDPKSDSVGETRTRLLLHDLGYEVLSQISIHDERDAFIGRVDFLVNKRIVVEFDGLKKYEGAEGRAALAKEKSREDALRALGYVVVRLVWADLNHPDRVARMMQKAMQQAGRRVG